MIKEKINKLKLQIELKQEEFIKLSNETYLLQIFINTYKNVLINEESKKALENIQNYIKQKSQLKWNIIKEKAELEQELISNCQHDIVINGYCPICNLKHDALFNIFVNNTQKINNLKSIIQNIFNESTDEEFSQNINNLINEIQLDYEITRRRIK